MRKTATKKAAATGDERRAALVEAAYRLIAEKGIEGLRTRDVAAAVGINISTLHYHFDSKENLVAGVIDHVTHLFQTLRAPLPVGATSIDELRNMFESPLYRRKHAPELEIVVQETMLHARRDPKLRATFDKMLHDWRTGMEHLVLRCIRDKYLSDRLDASTVATTIVTMLMGATMQLGLRPSFSLPAVSELFFTTLLAPPASRKSH